MTTALYKELRYSEDISKISQVVFSLLSPEEIRNQSTCKVENWTLYISNSDAVQQPCLGGLYDQRMGVIDNNLRCNTCEQNSSLCPGHFGHIELAKPIFHMHFIQKTIKILRCICFRCSKLLFTNIIEIDRQFYNSKEDVFDYICEESKKIKECKCCGALQPTRYNKEGVGKLYAEWKYANSESKKVLMRAEYVLKIFSRISEEDIVKLGFDPRFCRPEWLICTVLPVPPPSVRPSVKQDNNQRSDDDLTYKLVDIVKCNKKLLDYCNKVSNDENSDCNLQKTIDEHTSLLQYHCATLINNETPFGSGVPQASVQRSGRNLKSIQQRVKSKEGRIRGNLMGKRVDYSARSVITPDPLLGIDELGVPIKIAMNLTYPEKVTLYNIDEMKSYINNGYDIHPGAKSVVIYEKDNKNPSVKNLKASGQNIRQDIINKLKVGDIVNRHIKDGDIVLFNRQPSLHKMSMMGHKIKIMKADTFRLNVCVTSPYNADFDGDEMNMHVPQSLQTISELKHLAMVSTQIISPQEGKPVIGLVQDALLGSNRITMKNDKMSKYMPFDYGDKTPEFIFNERQFNNLMMFNDNFTGLKDENGNYLDVGTSIINDQNNDKYWTGQQIFSSLLPNISNFVDDVKILDGNLLYTKKTGNEEVGLVKKHLGSSAGGLVHVIFNDLGKESARDYLNNNQRVINNFVFMTGFSVGISDLIANNNTKKEIKNIIQEKIDNVHKISENVRNGLVERKYEKTLNQEFETLVFAELNKAMSNGGVKAKETLNSVTNNIVNMISAGSKGSDINLGQMIACLGQQSIDGKRVPYHYNNRTLPHFSQYDSTPESRGFIQNNFYKGLTPYEYYFHAMTGREGIIDTAVKTSETGYVQRKLIKSMEDVKINYDDTVRNHNDEIIQFLFGEDGMESSKLERQNLNLLLCDDLEKFKQMYDLEFFNLPLENYFNIIPNKDELVQTDQDATRTLEQLFKENYEQLLKYRIFVQNNIVSNKNDIYYPMNFQRIIINNLIKNNIYAKKYKSDLEIEYIFEEIKKLTDEFKSPFQIKNDLFQQGYSPTEIFSILLKIYLSPYNIVIKNYCDKKTFDDIILQIKDKFYSSKAEPGDNVGTITAQSIGEPATQMTLNTFHYAGVSSKSNVTRGVPRLKELLSVSKNIKNPSLTLYLKDNVKMEDIQEIKNISNKIIITKIKDIIKTTSIYFDPDPLNSLIKKYNNVINEYEIFRDKLIGNCGDDVQDYITNLNNESPFILDLEFSKKKLLDKNIELTQIMEKIYNKYQSDLKCIISTDENNSDIDTLFMRISTKVIDDNYDDNICVLKLLEKDILDIEIQGITNLTNVNIRKDIQKMCDLSGDIIKKEKVILDTDGTNLLDILINHNSETNFNIDTYKTISNDIQEIYSVLGVEAARTILINEFNEVIESAGASLNLRHILLLADTMTFSGGLMSIDRFGINKSNYGTLAKCSFEEMSDQIFNSALFGEVDHCKGISANVIFGQEGNCGTGISDMYFDEYEYLNSFNHHDNQEQENECIDNIDFNFDEILQQNDDNYNSINDLYKEMMECN